MNHSTEAQDAPNPTPPEITMIEENGNALIHSLEDLPNDFEGSSGKILDRLSVASSVFFSTNMYQ